MKVSQLRRIIRESILDLFEKDPDFVHQKGFTERHYSADTMYMRDVDGNFKKFKAELAPQLSPNAQFHSYGGPMRRKSGSLQVSIKNASPQDDAVMKDYGFEKADIYDLHKHYRDEELTVYHRTISSASNYADHMSDGY